MTTRDFTIVRGTRSGIFVPDVTGELYAHLVSPQDGFPLLRLAGSDGLILLEHDLTAKLAFKVADYYVWDENKVLKQRGRIYVRGPYPEEQTRRQFLTLTFTGPGPHLVVAVPELVFVNGVLYQDYQLLSNGLYLPGLGEDDTVTVLTWA